MPSINEQYTHLLEAFRMASERLKATAAIINKVGSALASGSFRFTQSDPLPSSATVIDTEETMVRVDQWPTAGEIMQIQKAVCDARENLINFHNHLSESDRAAMKPLPPGVQPNRTFGRKTAK